MSHTPFRESCPSCEHTFSLAELKEMAVGDGYERMIVVRFEDGSEGTVWFDDYEPLCMTDIGKRSYFPTAVNPQSSVCDAPHIGGHCAA